MKISYGLVVTRLNNNYFIVRQIFHRSRFTNGKNLEEGGKVHLNRVINDGYI